MGLDVTKAARELETAWHDAGVKQWSDAHDGQFPSPEAMAEINKDARERATNDLWGAVAAARNVLLIDHATPGDYEKYTEMPPVIGEAMAFLRGHAPVAAYHPTVTEIEREHWGEHLFRLGIMDFAAPWFRELRTHQLGLDVTMTPTEKAAVDQITALRATGAPDDETARERMVRDYANNYYLMDEFRRWTAIPSYLAAKAFTDQEGAIEFARDVSESPGVTALGALVYFGDVDVFMLGSAGLGLAGSRIGRTAIVSTRLKKEAALAERFGRLVSELPTTGAIEDQYGALAKLLGELHTESGPVHQRVVARMHEEVAKTLHEGLENELRAGLAASTQAPLDDAVIAATKAAGPEAVAVEVATTYKASVASKARVQELQEALKAYRKTLGDMASKATSAAKARYGAEMAGKEIAAHVAAVPEGPKREIVKRLMESGRRLLGHEETLLRGGLRDEVRETTVQLIKTEKQTRAGLLSLVGREVGSGWLDEFHALRKKYVGRKKRFLQLESEAADPRVFGLAQQRVYDLNGHIATAADEAADAVAAFTRDARRFVTAFPGDAVRRWIPEVASVLSREVKRSALGKALGVKIGEDAEALRLAYQRRALEANLTREGRDLRAGLEEWKARRTPVKSAGIPFFGVHRGLPEDEFTRIEHTVREFLSAPKDAAKGAHTLDATGYYKKLVETYGEDAVQQAVKEAQARVRAGLQAREVQVGTAAERLVEGAAGARGRKAAEKAAGGLEGRAATKAELAAGAMDEARKEAEAHLELAGRGARGSHPDKVFLKAIGAAAGDAKPVFSAEDILSLDAAEETVKEAARWGRSREREWREALAVLQAGHELPYMGEHSLAAWVHGKRLRIENMLAVTKPFDVRIGGSSALTRQLLRTIDNVSDRITDEMIQVANYAVKRKGDPTEALLRYLTTTEPMPISNGQSFFNTIGNEAIYTRARRAILSDPRTFQDITGARFAEVVKAASASAEGARAAATTINVPLLGLSRMFLRHGDTRDAYNLYRAALDALQAHETPKAFVSAMRKGTLGILSETDKVVKFDKRLSRNLAMGARLFGQAAVMDHTAWMIWRRQNGVLDPQVARDVNRLMGAEDALPGLENVDKAFDSMLRLGMSPLIRSVEQAPSSSMARVFKGIQADSRKMIELAYQATPGSVDHVFTPHVLAKEIGRKLDSVVKELDPYRIGSPARGWGRAREIMSQMLLMWRRDVTTGLILPNPRYFTFNALGDWSQVWVEAGFGQANRMALHNWWSLIPGVGRKIQDRLSEAAAKQASKGKGILPTFTEAAMNPHIGRFWNAPSDAAIELAGKRWTVGELRQIAVEEGVLDTFLASELHEVVRSQMKAYKARIGTGGLTDALKEQLSGRLERWQGRVEDFGVAWQQRQRVLLWLQQLDAGKTVGEASKVTRGALYDWAHGISGLEREVVPLFNQLPFARFMRLYVGQSWRAVTELMTKPDLDGILKTMSEGSKLQRLRAQHLAVARGVPATFEAALDKSDWTLDDFERQAFAKANRPEWTKLYPYMGAMPLNPAELTHSREQYGPDYAHSHKYMLLPHMMAMDSLEWSLLPFKMLSVAAMAAMGEGTLADNAAAQMTLKPFVGMLYPPYREAVEDILGAWDVVPSKGKLRSGEWRIRPEEATVMSKIPIWKHYVRKEETPGDAPPIYKTTRMSRIALRSFPVLLGRFPTIFKYLKYQNHHNGDAADAEFASAEWATAYSKMIASFLVNWGGLVRSYHYNPEQVQSERLEDMKWYMERAQERAVRAGNPVPFREFQDEEE
jgi:hypothetical protein